MATFKNNTVYVKYINLIYYVFTMWNEKDNPLYSTFTTIPSQKLNLWHTPLNSIKSNLITCITGM